MLLVSVGEVADDRAYTLVLVRHALACLCMELLVLLVLAVSCASSRSKDGPKEQAGWAEHPPPRVIFWVLHLA